MLDETILRAALDAARTAGATYAEVRGSDARETEVAARDGAIDAVNQTTDTGWGLRVAVTAPSGGGWGFAASSLWDVDSARAIARQAVAIAQASAIARRAPIALDDLPTERGVYASNVVRDPFTVETEEQIDLVIAATTLMRAASQRIVATSARVHAYHTEKWFFNTLGADLRQTLTEVSGGIDAIAQDESGYTYRRSYGNMQQGGWEFIDGLLLREHAPRVGNEAGILVAAPWAPTGPQNVIIGTDFMALIIHESCGHPTELDRVLGWEAAFAGTSFLMPEMRDTFTYGAPGVTIIADSTTPGGLGTFGWDDEGTPAQRWELVRGGQFVGYLSNRESAAAIGQQSNGCGRASGWNRMPIVRMVNVSLKPGDGSLDDLCAEADNGLYIETPSSWSLDDKRMNFNFSGEMCREISGGKLGVYYKGAAFQARTPDFWGACRAVGGPSEWQLHGFAQCAKGEPLQLAHVAHGAAPTLIAGLSITRE